MRRGKLSNISVKIVIIAGFFSLLSIFLDQLVIQKEDSLRINQLKIDNQIEKANELAANVMSVLMFEDRIQTTSNYYSFFSSLFYKILLNMENDTDFKKKFKPDSENLYKEFIRIDTADMLFDMFHSRFDLTSMSFYYYEYSDEALENQVKNLFLFENPLEESLIKKIGSSEKIENFSSDEIYKMYQSLFQLNKQFAIYVKKLNDVSDYFGKKEEITDSELDAYIQNNRKIKTSKNYLILSSILSQII